MEARSVGSPYRQLVALVVTICGTNNGTNYRLNSPLTAHPGGSHENYRVFSSRMALTN